MALTLILSLLIGLALGLFGGGGSILTVPVLTYAAGMPARPAIAASLLVVAITSLAALLPHVRHGRICWRTGLVFGAFGMLGAYGGGRLAAFIPGAVLLIGFAVIMVLTAVAMLRSRDANSEPNAATEDDLTAQQKRPVLFVIASHGLVVGAITGLVGAGGGFLIVPALVLIGGMPIRRAIPTSLLVIAMKSLAGYAGYARHTEIDSSVVAQVAAAAVVGSIFGGLLVKRVAPRTLKKSFAWFILAMAVFVTSRELPSAVRSSTLYQAMFVERWPWWIGGMAIAGIALALLFTMNRQLGVSTGYSELCAIPRQRSLLRSWRPAFLLGIVLGGAAAAMLAGRAPSLSMGALDELVRGNEAAKLVLLLAAGTLIGLGARLAGGCTSGHSIVGTALGARSSWTATALFMLAGFATTALLVLLTGGSS